MTEEPCTHGCQCEFCREDEPETLASPLTREDVVKIVNGMKAHQAIVEANDAGSGEWESYVAEWARPEEIPDMARLQAQEAGEASEQPLAVCWASAKGSPLWSDPQPPVAAGPALAAGTAPIKAMDEYAKRTEQAVGQALNNQQGRTYQGSGLGHVDPFAQQRTPQGGTILGLDQAGLQALQDDLNKAPAGPLVPYPGPVFAPLPQHPSGVQMLIDDLNAVTRERDAAIAEMGRLEKERDIARSDNVLLRLELTGARLMAATLMGTAPRPSPGIPLRALGGTHAATGLKMGERG